MISAAEQAGKEAPFYAAVRVLRQRWWVVVLCAILVPTAAYLVTSQQDERYVATAKLLLESGELERGIAGVSPTPAAGAQGLDPTNLDLVSLRTIAERAAQRLPGELEAGDVSDRVEIVPRPDSNVVGIQAAGSVPRGVAPLANSYAEAYIEFRRDEASGRIRRAADVIDRQIDSRRAAGDGREQLRELRERRDDLDLLERLQNGNARVVERAVTPESPVGPKPRRSAMIGLGFGFVLGIGLALLFEFLSRRLNDPQEIEGLYDEAVLGTIPESRAVSDVGFAFGELPAAEHAAFQRARGNLRYYNDYNIASVLVVSALPGEGKSTVARHLAGAAAEAGTKVLLLEADMRAPTLVAQVGLPPTAGLVGLLEGSAEPADVIQRIPGPSVNGQASVGILDVISAGPPQQNPAYLVESDAMERLILDLEERYDLVVIDTPAITMVSDGLSLVDKVGGVIVVNRVRHNTRAAAQSLRAQLANVDATVLGVIVNGVDRSDGIPGYGYGYGPGPEAVQPSYRVPTTSDMRRSK